MATNQPTVLVTTPPVQWAPVPDWCSFWWLIEVETCPRRVALRHANYPDVWGKTGYPPNHKFIRLLDRLSTQQLGRSLQSCASEEQHQSANRVPYRFCASLVDFPKSFRANEAELRTLESELLARTASAKTAMLATQPPAQIAPDNCNQCDVKHLCSDYWIPHSRKVLAPESRVEFDDVELLIEERLGEQSWRCKCLLATHIPINSSVLLRVGHDNTTLDCG